MLRDLTYLFLISLKSKVAFVYLKTVILSNLIGRYHTVAIRVYARLWVRCHTGEDAAVERRHNDIKVKAPF